MKRITLAVFVSSLVVFSTFGLEPQPDSVFVRVVDVGAGLCCVITMPENHYMIYDAGNYQGSGRTAIKDIKELIPTNSVVDLLVLSHTDSDHVAAVRDICANYRLKRIVHPGLDRNNGWYKPKAFNAIKSEVTKDHAEDMNLEKHSLTPGQTFDFGPTKVTLVCGFSEPPPGWDIKNDSEFYNAGSIIVRLQYKGKSVLFCGDAVGRHLDDPPNACIAAEKFMVDNKQNVPIDSDVLVAPHHGADNGSSTAFIQAVSPHDVIFSAGHRFEHPRAVTVQRYLNAGITISHMFRTDRGDNEGGKEWILPPVGTTPDPKGDDDVDVLITKTGNVTVAYRN